MSVLFKKAEKEGYSKGYQRGADEFDKIYSELQTEFDELKKTTEEDKEYFVKKLEKLCSEKEQLETEIHYIENLIKGKCPKAPVAAAAMQGSLLLLLPIFSGFWGIKKKVFREAELKGYEAAKKIHIKKIDDLMEKIKAFRENARQKNIENMDLICEVMEDIEKDKATIVQLKEILYSLQS